MRLVLPFACVLMAAPACAAEAVTYQGTLGDKPVVVELTDLGEEIVAGRFSYLDSGMDIPLASQANSAGAVSLVEEAQCTEQSCVIDDEGNIEQVPVAGVWTLEVDAEGKVSGARSSSKEGGESLSIELMEAGRRTLPEGTEITPLALRDSAWPERYQMPYGFAPEALPYESAKMAVGLEEVEPVQTLEGSTYRFVVDPRTKLAFPRLVSLADGTSPDAANAALAQRHAAINAEALDCLAGGYAGFSFGGYSVSMEGGSLGGYDDENIEIAYLSPTVLNWTEAGSTYCGGAHPNNHYDSFIMDVRTGEPLPLGKIFKDWTAISNINDYEAEIDQAEALQAPQNYLWAAGQPLIDYVVANRTPGSDASFEEECGFDELIQSNLGMRFAPGDKVVFALQGLPHVSFACTSDLLTVELSQIPELLAPDATQYLPGLSQ
ncbi:hypothetical protein [Devosia submarina]|uniref:hypothetical protein n=1 Tax=Devosia submarina TaxID=1173082 RepID=UPI001300B9C5|nr:hypothetical protein [Devosia submarina]